MKHIIFLMLFLFSTIVNGQSEKKIVTKVSSATIFKNRALVTREGEINLSSGKFKILISNLPDDLQDESVRISSDGENIKILDVQVERKFTTETQQDKIKLLENRIDSLNQLLQVAADRIMVYHTEKEFIESLKAEASKNYSQNLLKVNSMGEWNNMLKYLETNLTEIYKGLREQNRIKLKLEQQINAVKMDINNSQGTKSKSYKEIIVNIDSKANDKIKLFASYLVNNASWYPMYDARVSINDKNTQLHYYGMIHQSTGEDWNDVSLSLSTAEPMNMQELPELTRWFVDDKPFRSVNRSSYNAGASGSYISYEKNSGFPSGFGAYSGYITDETTGEPLFGANAVVEGTNLGSASDINGKFYIPNIPYDDLLIKFSMVGYQAKRVQIKIREKNIASYNVSLAPASIETNAVTVTAERPLVLKDMTKTMSLPQQTIALQAGVVAEGAAAERMYNVAEVSSNELSTNFEVPSKSTIPSDNNPHKVTIAIDDLPVMLSYTTIPKINPAVYLKGKIVNKNDYPLLEGNINIFVENDFVSKTSINTIVPTDTFELALGIDDKIQVKKSLINKFHETKGLLGGKKQISYDYEIQVTNNRTTEANILVYDQIPISMNEDIKVNLLEPKKEKEELGNENKLEWNIVLKPGEKKILPMKYKVLYPENVNVYGLE